HGFTDSRIHGFTDSRIHGHLFTLRIYLIFCIKVIMAYPISANIVSLQLKRIHGSFKRLLTVAVFFCVSVLSAQVITLPFPVKNISVNDDGSIIAAADKDSVALYETPSYTPVKTVNEIGINRAFFHKEANAEFLMTMTDDGTFSLHKRNKDGKKITFSNAERYVLSDFAENADKKTLTCTSFSKNTDYIAAAYDDYSVCLYFKLRFTQNIIKHSLEAHKSDVYGLEFSDDEKYLASVSTDGNAYIWFCATSEQAAHISKVYTKQQIPVYFSADGLLIISQDGKNSFKVSDLSGQKLYSVNTGRKILALKPLTDPDKVAAVTDKNEIAVYSLRQQKLSDVVLLPEYEKSPITSFTFSSSDDTVLVGCESGAVYKIKPLPRKIYYGQLGEGGGKEAQAGIEEGGNPKKAYEVIKQKLKNEKKNSLSVGAISAFLTPEQGNYTYLFGGEVLFRTSMWTPPVYEGLGLRMLVSPPNKDFSVHYEDFEGNTLKPPLLFIWEACIPAGMEFELDKKGNAVLFEEISLNARLSVLNSPGVAASKPFFSGGARITTGITIKYITFALALNYDSLWHLIPEINLGGKINLTPQGIKK
ncbi:MAG: WD40 repeat domain-containing protein, partial [Treponema sp.]